MGQQTMIKRTYALEATATLTPLYTVPEGARTELVMLWISNTSGSNESVTVKYYNNASSTTITILNGYTISSKTFERIGGDYNTFLVMGQEDYIEVSSTQACTFIASVIEYDNQFKNL